MVWPLLTKNDVFSLCEPFSSENSSQSLKEHSFAGFVFFDVGSVLIDLDWETFWQKISEVVNPRHKFSLEKFKSMAQKEQINSIWSQGKMSTHNYLKTIIEMIQLNCENKDGLDISSNDIKQADSFVVANARVMVLECVKKLREKNFAVGLLSNTTPWHSLLIHEKIQASTNFDVNIFSNDVGYEKPDTHIYQIAYTEACKFIKNKWNRQLEKKEFYFIDDTPANIHAALDFGWNARLVNLVKDEILNKMKHNEITDLEFQQASQKRENLLFGEQASSRVVALFGNLLK